MHPIFTYIQSQLRKDFSKDEKRQFAMWLTQEITHLQPAQIICTNNDTKLILPIDIKNIINRINNNEPLPYIFGHMQWMDLKLIVSPDVLIPRIETSELVQWILDIHSNNTSLRILDIGTGSGCIAIKLKHDRPQWEVSAVDISNKALLIAQQNASINKTLIHFNQQNILNPTQDLLIQHYDIIVCNPPYILPSDSIDSRVCKYEPHLALFAPDNDPYAIYDKIAQLKLSKQLFFEINDKMAPKIIDILKKYHYDSIQIKKDLFGKQRMVRAQITRKM